MFTVWNLIPVRRGEVDLEAMRQSIKMIKDGYAYLLSIPPNIKYSELFFKAISTAMENMTGLWENDIIIYHADDIKILNEQIGKYVAVEGFIKSTYITEQLISFNFGDDYRTDFSIVLFKNSCDKSIFELPIIYKASVANSTIKNLNFFSKHVISLSFC